MRARGRTLTGMLWAVPAAVAGLVSAAVLTGGGAAAAQARPGAATAAARSGVSAALTGGLTTLAGGIGGPGLATKVTLGSCGVAFGGDRLYVAGGPVHAVNPTSDQLTPVAGDSFTTPFMGDGGPATSAPLATCGVAVDASGNLVIADTASLRIRVVAATTGTFYGQAMTAGNIYTVAGNGTDSFTGNAGPATQTGLCPAAVAVDAHGNIIASDDCNQRIRVVAAVTGTFYGKAMTAGDIYSIAGTGGYGYSGDGGPATAAKLLQPDGVAVDAAGNVLVADTGNNRIRVIAGSTGTYYGQAMTKNDIYTIAGDGTAGYSGNGGAATAAELQEPQSVAVDAAGNVVIADTQNARVRVVAATAGTFYGQAMTKGDIYTIAGDGSSTLSGIGSAATKAGVPGPEGVAVDASGGVVIAGPSQVLVVAAKSGTSYGKAMAAGDLYAVAGNGETQSGNDATAASAVLADPSGTTVDGSGNVLLSEGGNAIPGLPAAANHWVRTAARMAGPVATDLIKAAAAADIPSQIRVVAKATGTFYGQAMTKGDIYAIAGTTASGYSGDGGKATTAKLDGPTALAVDASGNVLVADTGNDRIRVIAATTGTFYGQAMTKGDIYTVAGDGKTGYSGQGGLGTAAAIGAANGLAVDGHGNVLIADTGNNRILALAGKTGTFYGKAMTAGHLYLLGGNGGDGYAGDGGVATAAKFAAPGGVAADPSGNVVVADTGNGRIRVIAGSTGTFYKVAMTAGDVYTIAGTGLVGYAGDGGAATAAEFDYPDNVAVDAHGDVFVADTGNDRIREIAERGGTYYGKPMTTGKIYNVAGNGTPEGPAPSGDPATDAGIAAPTAVAADASGDLYFPDGEFGLLLEVTTS